MRQLMGWPARVPLTRNSLPPLGPAAPMMAMLVSPFLGDEGAELRVGTSARKLPTPNLGTNLGDSSSLVGGCHSEQPRDRGSFFRQPRFGALRVISWIDGTCIGCVVVYVRY